ncbi:hypothetical protein O9929_26545 [Vibrio lentus]|nr:hypothetical protein [Vibrio lentus]
MVHHHWRWEDAFTLIFIPPSQGSILTSSRLDRDTALKCLEHGVSSSLEHYSVSQGTLKIAFFRTLPVIDFYPVGSKYSPLVFVFIFYFFLFLTKLIPLLGLKVSYVNIMARLTLFKDSCSAQLTLGKLGVWCYLYWFALFGLYCGSDSSGLEGIPLGRHGSGRFAWFVCTSSKYRRLAHVLTATTHHWLAKQSPWLKTHRLCL